SDDSVNWKFRKLQTLVMQDYNAYAPDVQQTFEDKTMQDALNLTDSLTNQVFSKMTHATDMKYHFEGA
ncbi:dipeptidase, partial [Salmonella enterica subsp. enterica serovar Abaetetuba]|nr:dipeptidase [Salmonella enterica subsp. enterica serovar Abaetetuba]